MLNFTRQERVVIYFLIITLSVGAILKMVRNRHLDVDLKSTRFFEEEKRFKKITEQINSGEGVIIENSSIKASASTGEVDSSASGELIASSVKININTAGVEKLTELPGIGPAIGKRIRVYTDQNGPFKDKTEIILVKGIGEKLYTRIKGLITTE